MEPIIRIPEDRPNEKLLNSIKFINPKRSATDPKTTKKLPSMMNSLGMREFNAFINCRLRFSIIKNIILNQL